MHDIAVELVRIADGGEFYICQSGTDSWLATNFYNLIWDPIMQTFSDGNLKYLVAFTELRPIKLNNVSRNRLIPVRLAITIESLPRK